MDNKAFQQARLRLAIVYFVILSVVIILYSVISTILTFFIYENTSTNPTPSVAIREVPTSSPMSIATPEQVEEKQIEQNKVRESVVVSNVTLWVILSVASAIVSYIVAGKTMQPIVDIINRQKDFISNASHEFKTPLTTLRLYSEMVEQKPTTKNYHELKEILDEEVLRMTNLTNSLLAVVKSDDGKPLSVKTSLVLRDIIADVVHSLNMQAKAMGLHIQTSYPDAVNPIWGDPDKIHELISILIDNAIKFNHKDGSINIKLENFGVAHMKLSINDTGIGIEQNKQPRIFDKFFRASNDQTRPGFGLGLSIAKSIVQAHGISMQIASETGTGTTVTLLFRKLDQKRLRL